jgi:hypothetical protein
VPFYGDIKIDIVKGNRPFSNHHRPVRSNETPKGKNNHRNQE